MSKPKLNVRLLRKIQKHITEEPRRFMMAWFEAHGKPGTSDWEADNMYDLYDVASTVPECGTSACIAGWANALTGAKKGHYDDINRATEKLGLGHDFYKLFGYPLDYWPSPFDVKYDKARTPKQRAKIACARIDYLIKTGL